VLLLYVGADVVDFRIRQGLIDDGIGSSCEAVARQSRLLLMPESALGPGFLSQGVRQLVPTRRCVVVWDRSTGLTLERLLPKRFGRMSWLN
jgi:hypothetical protein